MEESTVTLQVARLCAGFANMECFLSLRPAVFANLQTRVPGERLGAGESALHVDNFLQRQTMPRAWIFLPSIFLL